MFYVSDYGNIVQIARSQNGYVVTIDQGDGFYRDIAVPGTAHQLRAWVRFHFGGV